MRLPGGLLFRHPLRPRLDVFVPGVDAFPVLPIHVLAAVTTLGRPHQRGERAMLRATAAKSFTMCMHCLRCIDGRTPVHKFTARRVRSGNGGHSIQNRVRSNIALSATPRALDRALAAQWAIPQDSRTSSLQAQRGLGTVLGTTFRRGAFGTPPTSQDLHALPQAEP